MAEGKWDLSLVDPEELKNSQATLVYGQMNEPPGARSSVALSGLTLAESFRDSKAPDGPKDILFFIDNIFLYLFWQACQHFLTDTFLTWSTFIGRYRNGFLFF